MKLADVVQLHKEGIALTRPSEIVARTRPEFELDAGGPGSGRHAEAGSFKKLGFGDTSRGNKGGVNYRSFYKAPSGAVVSVSRTKEAEGKGLNKQSALGESWKVRLGTMSDVGRKTFGGDRAGALQHLQDKYGIRHSV